jgi:histone acetyltransferase 1
VAFAKERDFEDSSLQLANNWTPPGQLHSTYTSSDGTYEIWRGRLDDPAIKQLNLRVQILVPMFIEGGSYIGQKPDSDDAEQDLSDADRWTVFFLYRKTPVQGSPDKFAYAFAGLSTVYRFYYFQPPTPPASPAGGWELPEGDMNLDELPCRTRLSQFLILPPFQKKGNGSYLYKAIFEHYLEHTQTQEFTVENPNEAFDDLRDICDLAYLRTVPEFAALRLDPSITLPKTGPIPQLVLGGDKLEAIRQKAKIAPRQFHRVLEMYLMSQLPDSVRIQMPATEDGEEGPLDESGPAPTRAEEHLEKLWGLVVKQRLYRHNKDVLSQIELSERKEKLDQTLDSVGLDYARVLALHDRAAKYQGSTLSANGKRKMDEEADESSSKRARTDDA